jgi:hypothetical protein
MGGSTLLNPHVMTFRKRLALLSLLALALALVAAIRWVSNGRSSGHPPDVSVGLVAPATDIQLPSEDVAPLRDTRQSAAASEGFDAAAPGSHLAGKTTWGASIVMREDDHSVAGAALHIYLLSPNADNDVLVLVSDADGKVGPIEIEFDRHPAAEVHVEPGTQWASLTTTVHFTEGRDNHDVIALGSEASLEVRIVDALRAQPVSPASVDLYDAIRLVAEATCDTRGEARIPWVVAGGPFTVRPRAEGYVAVSWGWLAGPPESDLRLELVVAPVGVLFVRVQDESGRALENCEVGASLLSRSLPQTPGHSEVVAARWDPPREEHPFYRFSMLPCDVFLVVHARTADGYEGKVQVKLDASPGIAETTITVERGGGTSIQVLDDRGEPLGGVTLGFDKELFGIAEVLGTTDDGGRLSVTLQELWSGGELWAFKAGHALSWQTWTPELRHVLFRMALEGSVAGTVVDSQGRPQKLVQVTPLLGQLSEEHGLRQRRGQLLVQQSGGRARGTDASGAFSLNGLGGRWIDLYVRPPKSSSFEVREVLVGTRDLVVTIPDEATLGRERGIALSVAVFDRVSGAPVSGATVTAFHAPNGQAMSLKGGRGGTTETDGRVRVTFAEEGDYLVSVIADGYVPYKSAVIDYPIGEYAINVDLAPSCELEVVLMDASGGRVGAYWISAIDRSGATVFFEHAQDGGYMSGSAIETDVQGVARANRMSTGTLTLLVHDERGETSVVLLEQTVELIAGERTKVELRLP